jgi:tRNA U38,U39,U40 pseudouridine synthase TruA
MVNAIPSEAELRVMSRDELLQHALRLAATSTALSSARAVASERDDTAATGFFATPLLIESEPGQQSGQLPSPRAANGTGVVRGRPDDSHNAVYVEPINKKQRRAEERKFDMNKYGQRMIALKFSYLGWHFHGLATQPHSEPSVEDHLFKALLGTHLIESREDCCYSRAGRTDVGVSALCQVVGLRIRSNVVAPSTGTVELDYIKMLNSLLPVEIRVMCWAPVSDGSDHDPSLDDEANFSLSASDQFISGPNSDEETFCNIVRRPGKPRFSARFDATSRAYKYFFTKGCLDVTAMRAAARYFVGKHDFRNFCKIDAEKVTNFERVMYKVEVCRIMDDSPDADPSEDDAVDKEYTRYYIFVRGQAFLWHQVRCMAAVLFEIGQGNESPDIVFRMLNDVGRKSGPFSKGKPCYPMAPAIPLLLYECTFPPSVASFKVAVRNQQDINFTSFSRADADIANSYGTIASQTSIIHAMFKANDETPIDVSGREFCEQVDASPLYGSEREIRLLLPSNIRRGLQSAKHLPFERRRTESTLEDKQKHVEVKQARRKNQNR